MSRSNEPIAVAPQNDVYTGLLLATLVVVLVGLILLFMRASTLFPGQPLWSSGS